MKEDAVRRILSKLGVENPGPPNARDWMHTACPFARWLHRRGTDKSRGCAVKVEDNGISAYDCPACGQHGKLSGLARALAHYRGVNYDDIAAEADHYDMISNQLAPFDDVHEQVREIVPLDESLFEGIFEPIKDHPEAVAFMMSRGISPRTVNKLGLEYDPDKKRITFPVRGREGELYGWSGRTVIPNWEPRILDYQNLPKRALILGMERWEEGKPLVLVEGLFAYAHFHEIGVDQFANVGALLGSALTEEKRNIIIEFGAPVHLFVDPDQAGDKFLWGKLLDQPKGKQFFDGKGAVAALRAEVPTFVPVWPEGCDDPDNLTGDMVAYMMSQNHPWRGSDWGLDH